MKKIISSKSWLLINLTGTLCFCYAFLYASYLFFQSLLTQRNLLPIFVIVLLLSFLILLLFIIALNRLSCIIWCDGTQVGRKGLLFAFKHQIYVHEIKDITITSVPKQGEYVVIIDCFCNSNEGLSKKSYIRFEYTEANREFYIFLCNIKKQL